LYSKKALKKTTSIEIKFIINRLCNNAPKFRNYLKMKKVFFELPLRHFCIYFSIGKKIYRNSIFLGFILFSFLTSVLPYSAFSQPTVNFSYSYENVTRNNGGGTLETGDTIEMHALVNLLSGSSMTDIYFIAPITSGTQYLPGSLKLITNESVVLQTFSDASGDDAGVYDATPGHGVRINLGTLASGLGGTAYSGANFNLTTGGGSINGGDVPKGGGGTLGIIAYRLVITGSFGGVINPTGTFYYSYSTGGRHPTTVSTSYVFNYPGIEIVQNQGLCANFSSASFTAESSFGSGTTQNRAAGVNAPGYTKVNIGANAPPDGKYSVVNNTSATGATNNTVPYAPTASPTRVFGGYWDIIGDHTGAASTALGNSPVAPGTNGGYMLAVNADIATGTAYTDSITNLCPNTYYEFSAWIRNICGKCGEDQNGAQTYLPGVKPNLTYAINGIDYYCTGDIPYTATWVKRGFIYQTGPAQTSFAIAIKNNAAGGGGNDWVLDDIDFSTCYPNLVMNPNDTATACAGDPITITDTVKSYYNNYGNYQWQASADGGTTWFPVTISGGSINAGSDPQSIVPVLVNGLYQYHVDAAFTPATPDSGYYFRLEVATTQSNLTNANCSVANSQKVFLKVYSSQSACSVLSAGILNFSGSVINNKNVLQWTVQDDDNIKEYVIEKSTDGANFSMVGSVAGSQSSQGGNYIFTDPDNSSNINYYRLKLVNADNTAARYSKTILLYNRSALFKISTINPFSNDLKVNIYLPEQGIVEMNLYDMYGKILSKKTLQLSTGNSQVSFDNVSYLPPGMYILSTLYNGMALQSKLIKSD